MRMMSEIRNIFNSVCNNVSGEIDLTEFSDLGNWYLSLNAFFKDIFIIQFVK